MTRPAGGPLFSFKNARPDFTSGKAPGKRVKRAADATEKNQEPKTKNPSQHLTFTGNKFPKGKKNSIHQFKIEAIEEKAIDPRDFKGTKMLAVNVASEVWGLPHSCRSCTSPDSYRDGNKLVIIGFPATSTAVGIRRTGAGHK